VVVVDAVVGLFDGTRLSRPRRSAACRAARRRRTLSTVTAQLNTDPAKGGSNRGLTTMSAFSKSAMTDSDVPASFIASPLPWIL